MALLDALCGGALDEAQRSALLDLAAGYPFRTLHCRVIFEALAGLPVLPVPELKRELASALTRNGFPDLPIERHFEDGPMRLTYAEIVAALRRRAGTGKRT